MTRVIAVVNQKPGTGKTTTAAFLLHALAEEGHRPLGVDADPPGSLVEWAGIGEWSIPVVGLATTTLHRQLPGFVDPARTDVVVIDTPPLEERKGIVHAALMVATDVLVTMAPTTMELHRVQPVWDAIQDAASARDEEPNLWILLNRTVTNANSTGSHRAQLTAKGHRVLATTVPRLELFAQAFGDAIAPGERYHAALAKEITREWR